MHILEKHWQQTTVISLLLLPLSILFSILAGIRRIAYRLGVFSVVSAPVPVVVVGNLSVGGTGKTPVVIWLAKELQARGFTPGIISRGYGGSGEMSEVLATSSPRNAGDEPVMIARRLRPGLRQLTHRSTSSFPTTDCSITTSRAILRLP